MFNKTENSYIPQKPSQLILFGLVGQSCLTLCDPIDSSPPGSSVPGILQARTLEWVAISFSNACKWKVKVKLLSRVRLFATPWTAAYQAPPSMGFSRQEYWSGVPLSSPRASLALMNLHFNKNLWVIQRHSKVCISQSHYDTEWILNVNYSSFHVSLW